MADWINEPPSWHEDGNALNLTTGPDTDYWASTFYGYTHANGHFRAHDVPGDFTVSVSCSFVPRQLYDQAGLMVLVDGGNWLKAGMEFTDGSNHLSVVVTRDGQSDWSMIPLHLPETAPAELRITRHAEALWVQYRSPGGQWHMARLAYLDMPDTLKTGMMACSPLGRDLDVQFWDFAVGPAISRELHD